MLRSIQNSLFLCLSELIQIKISSINLTLNQITSLLIVHMNRYSHSSPYSKPYTRISSERTTHKEQAHIKQSSHAKFYNKQNSSDKNLKARQFETENNSQKKLPYHVIMSQEYKKSRFDKSKIYRSYSQTKNKLSVHSKNEEFLIRIPKNQNLIQNYIQQLKQLKLKIALEKANLQQFHLQNNAKNHQFSLKLPKQQFKSNLTSPSRLKQSINQKKKQSTTKPQDKIFTRDLKKHIKKLKIFKDFVDQNHHQFNHVQQQISPNKHNSALKPTIQSPLKQVNQQSAPKDGLIYQSQPKFSNQWPTGIMYGNVINVKQEFKIGRLASDNKFNRYSSKSGRKLVAVSNSLNLRQKKERMLTEQKIERYNNSRSLVLKRRKTQFNENQTSQKMSKIHQISPIESNHNQAFNKDPHPQNSSPTKKNSSQALDYQELAKAMKSIQGYSTIQAKKETIDILGESCMEIKKNLVQSNKKMDCILDMLGYDLQELKEPTQRDKKRKVSYERFSKAFPKGFFNT